MSVQMLEAKLSVAFKVSNVHNSPLQNVSVCVGVLGLILLMVFRLLFKCPRQVSAFRSLAFNSHCQVE